MDDPFQNGCNVLSIIWIIAGLGVKHMGEASPNGLSAKDRLT